MKKILSAIAAAVAALTMSTAVFAEEVPQDPTFLFDTDASLSYVHTFGNAAETNLKVEISDAGAVSGRCLKLSESFTENIGNQYGGIYFDSADFGLENFAGYTLTAQIKFTKEIGKAVPTVLMFTDGAMWYSEDVDTSDSSKYITASVTVPAGKTNNKLGISIPVTSAFTGDLMYIDNVVISDNYGKTIANIGDKDTSLAEAPNGAVSVLTTILFIILILAVVGAVGFIAYKIMGKYR